MARVVSANETTIVMKAPQMKPGLYDVKIMSGSLGYAKYLIILDFIRN